MKKSIRSLFIFALGSLALPTAYADNVPGSDRGPNYNDRLESKGSFKLGRVPTDGALGAEYTGTFSDGRTDHGVNLRFESNLVSFCHDKNGGDKYNRTSSNCLRETSDSVLQRVSFMPVQFTARLNLDHADKDSSFLVNKFKASVFRILYGKSSGVTLEALGYLNQFVQRAGSPYEGMRLQGIEVIDVKVLEEVELGTPNLKLEFSLRASFGLGWANRKTIAQNFEFDRSGPAGPTVINPDGFGSIGLIIYKNVTAALFGGVDTYHGRNLSGGEVVDRSNFLHPYYGARAHYELWNDGVDRSLSVDALIQRDHYIGDTLLGDGGSKGLTVTGGATFNY